MLLQQVDRVEITILLDNVTDMLLRSAPHATRASFFKGPLRAEHGFSTLVEAHFNNISHRVLYDTGSSEDVVLFNANSLGIDLGSVETIVLSHGHMDHVGGLIPILKHISKPQMPVVLHPDAFLKRWIVPPNRQKISLPSMEEDIVLKAGAKVVKIMKPYSLLENLVATTSEIPRRTQFEQGMPAHYAEIDGKLQPDPMIREDQALVMNVKGKGLVIITGCAS